MTNQLAADEKLRMLYQSHRARIDAYCRRRVPAESVADVVSEVFMTAWRRIADIPDGSELPWLYGVARRVVMNHRRGARRRHRLGAALISQPIDPAPDADVPVVRRAEDRMILEALASLSPGDQEILRLKAWEELSSAEIGAVLGISSAAVDMRLTRAKRRLRRALEAVGFFESVSSLRIAENGGDS